MITGSLRAARSRDPPSARALVWLRPTMPSLRERVNKSFTHFCTSATWVMTFDTVIKLLPVYDKNQMHDSFKLWTTEKFKYYTYPEDAHTIQTS